MKRFIITGAPGAGKTAILHHLEVEGFSVVEEAAADIIAAAQARGTVLNETADAMAYAEQGHAREKVVITVQ